MWQAMSFTEAMLKGDEPHIFEGKPIKVGDFVVVQHGMSPHHNYGRILSIDLVSDYPIKLEWYNLGDVKHISRFSPNELISLTVKENLDDARAEATAIRRAYAEQTPRG